MTAAVSWNLRITIKEGLLADFKTLMHDMVQATQDGSGALR